MKDSALDFLVMAGCSGAIAFLALFAVSVSCFLDIAKSLKKLTTIRARKKRDRSDT